MYLLSWHYNKWVLVSFQLIKIALERLHLITFLCWSWKMLVKRHRWQLSTMLPSQDLSKIFQSKSSLSIIMSLFIFLLNLMSSFLLFLFDFIKNYLLHNHIRGHLWMLFRTNVEPLLLGRAFGSTPQWPAIIPRQTVSPIFYHPIYERPLNMILLHFIKNNEGQQDRCTNN
jgi:hypothetical protein